MIEKVKCTGCMACLQSCPKSCIHIEQDHLGNLYPCILKTSCVNCGKCEQVCPELTPLTKQLPQHAWAAWSLDPETRGAASSGGAASEFYRQALKDGWWICGVVWRPDWETIHVLSKSSSDIGRFQQSKYVFSDSSHIYCEVAKLLKSGEHVLFISLPCKVAGLLAFLGGEHKNLLTVDLVCHGTPPQQILKEHINKMDPNHQATGLTFRTDNTFAFHLKKGSKTIYQKVGHTDTYLASFLEGLIYHPSCYQCNYAENMRVSDLTICDFWGLGVNIPFNHPYTGSISAVLTNTVAGQVFWNRCKLAFFFEERPIQEALSGNAQLNYPTPAHPKRLLFERLYKQYGFEKAASHILMKKMVLEQMKLLQSTFCRKLYHVIKFFIK